MNEPAAIVASRDGGTLRLVISGSIDENCDMAAPLSDMEGVSRLEILSGEVSRINSAGVRNWIRALARVSATLELVFHELSIPLVEQANMVPNFLPRGRVESFFAPYVCPECQMEVPRRLVYPDDFPAGVLRTLESNCEKCAVPLEFDDLEAEYFTFLEKQKRAR